MADNTKKTKIDLKARLGKTTQVGLGAPPGVTPVPLGVPGTPPPPSSEPGSVAPPSSDGVPRPPPSSQGSRPAPPMGIAPPAAVLSTGIPLPAFGPRPAPAPAPKPTAVQQTIKVEVGEEMIEERKKARNRAIMAAAGGVVLGIGLGFVIGGSKAEGDRVKAGSAMAGKVKVEVKATTDKLSELDKALGDVAEKLKAKAFPADIGTQLGGLKIPFDATNLDKPGINGIKQALFRPLIAFARDCEKLDKLREGLQSASTPAKDAFTKEWKEETAPMANFSVLLRVEGGKNVVAELVSNPTPFAWKGDQPEKYKVSQVQNGKAVEKEAKHFPSSKGDFGSGDTYAVPVDPKGTGGLGTDAIHIAKFTRTMGEMLEILHGVDDPQNPKPGLIKAGEDLAIELQKASLVQ